MHAVVEAGSAYSVTPAQSPLLAPHWPGMARDGVSIPIARTQPSDHHSRPRASMAMRWGVSSTPTCARMGYSAIASVVTSMDAMRETVSLFSVNQTRLALSGSPETMPYGCEFALGVTKSRNVWVTGSNSPMSETRCSVYQILPLLNVRSHGPLPGVTAHWPTNARVAGLNSPIILLSGVVNQTFPLASTATKMGWLPGRFGRK